MRGSQALTHCRMLKKPTSARGLLFGLFGLSRLFG
jgi:hypothetical protein